MTKLTTKNAVKVSINKTSKQIRFTQQYFRNVTEGELTLGTSKSFIILNKNRLDKMISEGYKVVDGITKSTKNITESIQTVDLTGDPTTEEAIRKYYVAQKQKKGIQFIKGASQKEIIPIWEQSTIDHGTYQRKLESEQAESMKSSFNVENERYYKKRERELGKVNDEFLMDVYEVMNNVGIVQ
jgi:hypothetical protein